MGRHRRHRCPHCGRTWAFDGSRQRDNRCFNCGPNPGARTSANSDVDGCLLPAGLAFFGLVVVVAFPPIIPIAIVGYFVLKAMNGTNQSGSLRNGESSARPLPPSSSSGWDSPKSLHSQMYAEQGLDEPDWGPPDPADMDYGPDHPNWPDYD